MRQQSGQVGVILVFVLLIIVVLIALLIASGGTLFPRHTPTPTDWWGTAIPSATATDEPPSPIETIIPTAWLTVSAKPADIPKVTHTATAVISPTLTIAVPPVVPTYTIVYRIERDCAPKYQWQACYWRCCSQVPATR